MLDIENIEELSEELLMKMMIMKKSLILLIED